MYSWSDCKYKITIHTSWIKGLTDTILALNQNKALCFQGMSDEHNKIFNRYTMVAAGFLMSALACLDVVGELLCIRFPLLFYVILGAIGIGIGNKARGWLQNRKRLKNFFKVVALTGCFFGFISAAGLTVFGANWDTKCSWRYCGRALGVGLTKSPFPVGTPTCRVLHLCVNEYNMSPSESAKLYRLIKEGECPAP